MRKFGLMVLIVCFSFSSIFVDKSQAQGKGKLLGGIALTVLGTVLAVDGFSEVVDKEWDEQVLDYTWQKDISDPEITITENVWAKEEIISWWAHHWWEVKNTGNVTVTDVDVRVSYYDSNYLLI